MLASLAGLALAAGPLAAPARADGDPASDVLATQALFLPWDAGVPAAREAQLTALIAAARRSHYQLRVALIASSSDLGSVTELWRRPQEYAEFLGEELSLVYRGPLLVIMPDGFGLYRYQDPALSPRSALGGVRPPAGVAGLASATSAAVRHLVAGAGHRLAAFGVKASPGAGSTDAPAWIVFAVGSALIILAWAASLHARPPRVRALRPHRPEA